MDNSKYKDMSDENKYRALQYEAVLRHIKIRNCDKIQLIEFPTFANMDYWITLFLITSASIIKGLLNVLIFSWV